jgi:L-fuculose-phosphate aldolase
MGADSSNLATLKEGILRATRQLFESGVMQASGHGNLSARIDAERMVITGIGSLRTLTEDDLAVVGLDGKVYEGDLAPANAEIVGMHACVYRHRPNVGAVVHTHSPHATAFALANEPIPCAYEAMLRMGMVDGVPVAGWAPRGSPEAVANIVEVLRTFPGAPAMLLGNHGLLAFAGDPPAAARLVVAMEEAAQMTLGARRLGGEKPFPPDALERERAHMARFGSPV